MKSLKIIVVLSLLTAGVAFAATEEKPAAPASKQAGCCAKAEKAGEKCTHPCCGEAAKEGNNCTTCKGSGKMEKKEEPKKEKM